MSVSQVRALGGFEALSDERLEALYATAEDLVARDLERLQISPNEQSLTNLVVLKTCELAARIVRTPNSESAGGISATYVPLNWRLEYGRALQSCILASEKEPRGGNI